MCSMARTFSLLVSVLSVVPRDPLPETNGPLLTLVPSPILAQAAFVILGHCPPSSRLLFVFRDRPMYLCPLSLCLYAPFGPPSQFDVLFGVGNCLSLVELDVWLLPPSPSSVFTPLSTSRGSNSPPRCVFSVFLCTHFFATTLAFPELFSPMLHSPRLGIFSDPVSRSEV